MFTNAPSGVVYDPGGPAGNYFDYNDCRLLIDPGCAGSITLNLTEFQSESCCDFLAVYNGDDLSQNLITWRGTPDSVTINFPFRKLLLVWHTDQSVIASGFRLTWDAVLAPVGAPVAGFGISDTFPALYGNVYFTDSTSNAPVIWAWQFGDSTTSTDQNPVHQYAAPGTYQVQLIATNCHLLTDTIVHYLTVQMAPVALVTPAQLTVAATCNASAKTDIVITNTGPGNLLYTLSSSGLSNITFTPSQGEIAPDSTITASLEVFTQGFSAGVYQGTVVVSTNEGAGTYAEVPLKLEVTEAPVLVLSPEIFDFGAIRQSETSVQSVYVVNNGCGTLEITAVTSDNNIFTPVYWPVVLYPFSGDYIQVSCTSQDTGLITGHLVIESNAGTFTYAMQVYVSGSPVLTVMPPAVEATLSCNDSTTISVLLSNTGLGDLTINSGPTNNSLNVLVLNALSFDYFPANNIVNWINEVNASVNFIYLDNYLSATDFDALFVQADMVIVPTLGGYGTYSPEQIKNALQQFTNRGGTVLVTGTPYTGYLQALGLLQAGPDAPNFSGQVFTPVNPFHPLVENIDFQFDISYDYIYGLDMQDAGFESEITFNGYDIVGYRPAGPGKVIYIAHECYYSYNQDRLLIQNAFKWSAHPKWLSYELPATVNAGDTAAVTLTLHSEGLWAGDYQFQVTFATNDPVHPTVSVPVTMHVEGSSEIELLTTSVHFGILQQFTQKTSAVAVKNNGCDTLFFNDFSFSGQDFSMGNVPPFILPGSEKNVQIVFNPQTAGNFQEILTILSSDGGIATVQLAGLVIGAPVATVTPGSISVSLNCDETKSSEITISNSGIVSYNYSTTYSGPAKVAVLHYGTHGSRFDNLIGQLGNDMPGVIPVIIDNTDPNALADSLEKVDIFIIPSIVYDDPATYTGFKTPIQNFINNGGIVQMAGVYYNNPLVQMGLVNSTAVFEYGFNETVTKVLSTHPMANGIADTITGLAYQYGATFLPDAGFKTILSVLPENQISREYLSYKSIGKGFLVWSGLAFEEINSFSYQITGNFFNWAYQPLPAGVTLSSAIGTIPSAASQTIQVEFAGENLPGGVYTGQIRVYGNDPVNNPVIIPLTLHAGFKPCANFEAVMENCDGNVKFIDRTINHLTSWYWSFGDGFDIFTANPLHHYAQEGNYIITLIGCNTAGCDTTQQTITVDNIGGPVASCHPVSISPCCDAGIRRLQLGSIDHSSNNAETEGGYRDFSCSTGTDLTAGEQYEITVVTGNQNPEFVVVWIDFNNDGIFSENEKGFQDQNFQNHHGFITVPGNTVKDIPLRLRIVSDYNSVPGVCDNINYGQAEDYYVVIKQPVVGADEPAQSFQAQIAPNPTSGESSLTFTGAADQTAELTIINQTGQVIKAETVRITGGEQKIELAHQEAGIYMVRLQAGDQSFVAKWVCF